MNNAPKYVKVTRRALHGPRQEQYTSHVSILDAMPTSTTIAYHPITTVRRGDQNLVRRIVRTLEKVGNEPAYAMVVITHPTDPTLWTLYTTGAAGWPGKSAYLYGIWHAEYRRFRSRRRRSRAATR